MKSFFFLCFLLSILGSSFADNNNRFLQASPSDPALYEVCEWNWGTVVLNKMSGSYLEIDSFSSFCPAQTFRSGWRYQTWCTTVSDGTVVFWNTVTLEFLGIVENPDGTFVLSASSVFDAYQHKWTTNIVPAVSFGSIYQVKGLQTYYLSQIGNYNGGGAVTATPSTPVGLATTDSGDAQTWWFGYIGPQAAAPVSATPFSCTVNIQSTQTPGTYLRADPSIVNMQFGHFSYEVWIIELTGELTTNGQPLFCLQNQNFGFYLSASVTVPAICQSETCIYPNGIGSVTTSSTCGPQEKFTLYTNANSGTFSLETYTPNVFLRMDGTGLTSFQGSGAGFVNLQYYSDLSQGTSSTEAFLINSI
jgi:hypothetical protein